MKFNKTENDKGKEGESHFKVWLEKNNLSYLYINQDFENFSHNFKDLYKRPDFLILIPQFGVIMVDVKNREFSRAAFTFSKNEVDKYSNLQMNFNLPLWFVVSNNILNFDTWYWISIKNVKKDGVLINKNNKFYSVKLSDFTKVSSDESLEKVFTSSLNSK